MSKRLNQTTAFFSTLFITLIMLSNNFSFDPTVYYVSTTGNDINDGTSWANAFRTPQKAFAVAKDGDQVWVAAGTYYPDEGPTQTNNDPSSSFSLLNEVSLYGGFAGTETLLNERNWKINTTVLSGNLDMDVEGEILVNAQHVVLVFNSCTIDGFTITGGNTSAPDNYTGGAGMYIRSPGSTLISNCRFIGNRAVRDGAPEEHFGGALKIEGFSPSITNCSFISNTADEAGAVCIRFATPTFTNCDFSMNKARSRGGAIFNDGAGDPILINCSFSGNQASSAGGVFNLHSSPTFTNCILWGNSGDQIKEEHESSSSVNNSIVQGGFPTGTGNLDLNPLFVDPANHNLQLKGCSPAINAGLNSANNTTRDLDNNDRVVQTTIDMGAYEYQADGHPSIVYVNKGVNGGNNDGSSWANAYQFLQDAILKTSCPGNVEIWVAKGTYYPDEGESPTNDDRSSSFNLRSRIGIYGGFNGTETSLQERNWNTNATILSGLLNPNGASNAYRVVTALNVDATGILDGFIVRDGKGDVDNQKRGAGLFISGYSPVIRNCTFLENRVKSEEEFPNEFSQGGAVYVGGSSPWFLNCGFLQNRAEEGGAVFISSSANALFTNCLFFGNDLYWKRGGAIFSNGSLTIINCSFSGNDASDGGAIFHAGSNDVITIRNSIFWNNTRDELDLDDRSIIAVSNSIVLGGYPGNGNLNQSPLFIDGGGGDLRLSGCSPAINAGSNTDNNTEKDLHNNDRIVHNTIDMGAYEFQNDLPALSLTCPANFTVSTDAGSCNATVSFTDANAATSTGCSPIVQYSPASGSTLNTGVNTVTVTATDARGNTASCSFTITVEDKEAPSITCIADQTIDLNASCTASMPNYISQITATDNCSSTSAINIVQSPSAGSALFGTGTQTVKFTASDAAGNTSTCSFTLTKLDKTPPVISDVSPGVVVLSPPNHKMRNVAVNYRLTDACSAVTSQLSVISNESVNGTGDGDVAPDWEIVDRHNVRLRAERAGTGEGRIYTVTIMASDASGNTSTASVQVRVTHNITTPKSGQSFKVGSTVTLTGEFWDKPGSKHTGTWLIDDNTTVKGTVTEPTATKNGKVTGSYKFNSPGVYKLQMNTKDQSGVVGYANTNGDLEAIVVIFDPNGGYAHGGGYFNSPVGALTSNSSAVGKASYGFAVNYFKGATYPKGETQFEFKIGEFEFNALNFEYMSIAGAKAQMKGTGKIIGGQSGINFILTVTDGQLDGTSVDKIRMKIYNKNTNEIYYDNQPGASDVLNPVTMVQEASTIVISGVANNNNLTTSNNSAYAMEETAHAIEGLQINVAPNPTHSNFRITINSINTGDLVYIVVTDMLGRIMEKRTARSGETVTIGDKYRSGAYAVRILQGKQVRQLKLVKIPD